jgi:hypothetical protein
MRSRPASRIAFSFPTNDLKKTQRGKRSTSTLQILVYLDHIPLAVDGSEVNGLERRFENII